MQQSDRYPSRPMVEMSKEATMSAQEDRFKGSCTSDRLGLSCVYLHIFHVCNYHEVMYRHWVAIRCETSRMSEATPTVAEASEATC